jgi:uncharacterized membrane-anchored protein YitT (DUF2179 family)
MISSRSERMNGHIGTETRPRLLRRGVTKIKGIGAYSGEDTNVLLTVVSKVESMKLRHLLEECDPNIFIIEYENVSVIGNFEKRL